MDQQVINSIIQTIDSLETNITRQQKQLEYLKQQVQALSVRAEIENKFKPNEQAITIINSYIGLEMNKEIQLKLFKQIAKFNKEKLSLSKFLVSYGYTYEYIKIENSDWSNMIVKLRD